ncbi:hypothetical protein OOK27_14420 [Streptomyces canus]|uniref:hypothetical protein n=1 Tax=Streptomyces canus TaxID=58343 RepID=UPI00225B6097|nr:hypothetical protein [Streptomyces canus]MCX5255317.1 hypothetical protein [Streptomyces canus]
MRVLAVWGVVVAVVLGGGTAVAAAVPEADLAYHGAASMAGGRVDVRFTPRNHGPAAAPDATVRLRWSEPLVDGQTFPEGCARSAERVVLCRVGALAADGVGKRVEMWVRLRGVPSEVLLEIDTVWNGGTVDRNRENGRQRVLVLDSGDAYYF